MSYKIGPHSINSDQDSISNWYKEIHPDEMHPNIHRYPLPCGCRVSLLVSAARLCVSGWARLWISRWLSHSHFLSYLPSLRILDVPSYIHALHVDCRDQANVARIGWQDVLPYWPPPSPSSHSLWLHWFQTKWTLKQENALTDQQRHFWVVKWLFSISFSVPSSVVCAGNWTQGALSLLIKCSTTELNPLHSPQYSTLTFFRFTRSCECRSPFQPWTWVGCLGCKMSSKAYCFEKSWDL